MLLNLRSSSALVASKRTAFTAVPAPTQGFLPMAGAALASPASVLSLAVSADEPPFKRQRVGDGVEDAMVVKSERLAELSAAVAASSGSPSVACEVYVSDLPWGTKAGDVESFFGIAGKVESVRMPTMDDGSTVGVAVVKFADFEGMSLALRMNGYPFNGKTIRVTVSRSS